MSSKITSIAEQAREHDRIFHASFAAVKNARAAHVSVRPHRAITPLKVTPYLLLQALLLPLFFCAAMLWVKPMLLEFWRKCIIFWSSGLNLPFSLSTQLNEDGQYFLRLVSAVDSAPMPSNMILLVTAVLAVLCLALSGKMNKANLPLKYPLRIVCVVQLIAVIYFWLAPGRFPYTIARHSEELMTIGYVVMMATPVMLAVGYYLLNQRLLDKVLYTLLILVFFAVMVPHQILVQALIMQNFSILFMPLFYICFGAVFDALAFVALYSWAVSKSPEHATV